jgi:GntR family transcriptional regulator, transcriptional repressor for pyruvate dehydrogenase complex
MDNIVINNFREVVVTKPVDIIINQIRELIISGQLKPGDKLPSERKLSERLNIGRTYVRDAIRKLEFYGILKTLPQSGTVVAGIGLTALEGLISDVLHLENTDFASLVETRVILEIESARLASERRTENDLKDLQNALARYYDKINNNEPAVEEDMMFHLKIAEASKNSVLKSLMLIIIPDILTSYNKYKICTNDRLKKRHEEHMRLYDCIASKDGVAASASMREHLKDILKQGKEIIKQ